LFTYTLTLIRSVFNKDISVNIPKTIILPVVFYGCETWYLTLKEEHRVRVSENRVLKRIFGPKREEVAGDWRRLHNEGLHNLYTSPIIVKVIKSRRMRWTGHIARMGEMRNAYKSLVGKPERKRPRGRPRHRWEDSITRRMSLRGIEWESVEWMHLAQDRDQLWAVVNTVMKFRVP
jgi:hypothetical protein